MVEKTHTAGLWPSVYEPFRSLGARVADWLAPAADATSGENSYQITMELPGVEEGEIDVTVNAGVITVKGEKTTTREEKGETWFFNERQYGSFSRAFRLPEDADPDAVGADLKNGVLTITVPKRSASEPQPAKVKINKG